MVKAKSPKTNNISNKIIDVKKRKALFEILNLLNSYDKNKILILRTINFEYTDYMIL
jgi:Ribonuclease G/E